MKNKKYLLFILPIFLLTLFIVKYLNKDYEVIKTNKNIKKMDYLTILLETDIDSGEYAEPENNTWPVSNYILNETLTKCMYGSKINFDKTNRKINIESTTSDKCYVYFDRYNNPVVNSISLTENTTTIDVSVNASNGTNNISKYYYSIDNTNWVEKNTTSHTFTGLTPNQEYTVYVKVSDTNNIYSAVVSDTITTTGVYTVTFDYNGATGGNTVASKQVTLGQTYGELPTPTKTGYTFMGWHGKNILNVEEWLNSFNQGSNCSVTKTNNSLSLTATGDDCYSASWGYDTAYRIYVKPSTNYTLSWKSNNTSVSGNVLVFKNNIANAENISYINQYYRSYLSFSTGSDTEYITIRFGVSYSGDSVTYSDIQLEEGSSATAYEPYIITSNTEVIQNDDHTLKAIWEPY